MTQVWSRGTWGNANKTRGKGLPLGNFGIFQVINFQIFVLVQEMPDTFFDQYQIIHEDSKMHLEQIHEKSILKKNQHQSSSNSSKVRHTSTRKRKMG